ncbi:hypothetical protein HFO94_25025 [Rhizobium leguminosarum]|uniref:hypothetical protein n=1 Tax=Rhizobium TaxID=379 RepID=UPI00103E102D|nr:MULTISPECIES: hypothetical protein [Rhizobium]MBB3525850.1 hypothetical protein [Rhizobium sp. BK456]MBY2967337.1 hypothetical protein [Rhizobium leguminosarum]MBY3031115.1 hypothetical protein [Rhizobium leguminosarum]MBY3397091.1 hypothetical protein [Rhizobium laguerreae]MBY3418371.1 hypothetical protein [Rhizobium laguerreae]
MASPWKLLARLVSPRRQQRQEHGSTDGVKPDVLAIAKPTERAANNELDATDGPADKKPVPHGHSAAVLAVPDYSEETASAVDVRVDIDGARPVEAPDPALSDEADTAAHAAPRVFRLGEGQTRKRGKKAKMSAVVLRPSSNVSTASDDAINLDEEISLLRDQLARKLQMQNALLRRMLERFEY